MSTLCNQVNRTRTSNRIPTDSLCRAAEYLRHILPENLTNHIYSALNNHEDMGCLTSRVYLCDDMFNFLRNHLDENLEIDSSTAPEFLMLERILDQNTDENKAAFEKELENEVLHLQAEAAYATNLLRDIKEQNKRFAAANLSEVL